MGKINKMEIFYSPQFLKSFKKLPKEIQDLFRVKEIIFRKNPFNPILGTHKLKGENRWSFCVTYKIRVIFNFQNDTYILVNIGDHSIYK